MPAAQNSLQILLIMEVADLHNRNYITRMLYKSCHEVTVASLYYFSVLV